MSVLPAPSGVNSCNDLVCSAEMSDEDESIALLRSGAGMVAKSSGGEV